MSPVADVEFFPTLRYRGWSIMPEGWEPDSAEPRLRCAVDGSDVAVTLPVPQNDPVRMERAYRELVQQMSAEGWEWDLREGGRKYLHVDEIERIPGPVPTGQPL